MVNEELNRLLLDPAAEVVFGEPKPPRKLGPLAKVSFLWGGPSKKDIQRDRERAKRRAREGEERESRRREAP